MDVNLTSCIGGVVADISGSMVVWYFDILFNVKLILTRAKLNALWRSAFIDGVPVTNQV